MNLTTYVESLREQLMTAADMGGPDSRAVIERISVGLETATRLVLLEALSSAADEITMELAPGSVEVRLRGSDPDFVVNLPSEAVADAVADGSTLPPVISDDEGGTSRLNLRLPEALKSRIEEAARREGLSLNTWLIRAAAAAVDGPQRQASWHSPEGAQKYTGWVR